jgi:pilus assembly protein Flp/PilA
MLMRILGRVCRALLRDRNGATAVEYGLILALVVLAVIVGFRFVRDATQNTFGTVTNSIDNAVSH